MKPPPVVPGRATSRHPLRALGWGLVLVAALVAFSARYTIGINVTPSLAYTLCIIAKGDLDLRRGDLAAFRWHGAGPYPAGVVFTKVLRGMPGDVVSQVGSEFFVNGESAGHAKPYSRAREALTPGPTGVIPEGHYFVSGNHPDSLDSRYALAGWIRRDALIGKAYVVF